MVLQTPAKVDWQIVSTPPMSGADNMAYDLNTLRMIQNENHPPVLRFFHWSRPAVSYGKHQSLDEICSLIPSGWDTVQRPTGGGLVFHGKDLCLSLCWSNGQPPLPTRLKDHYAWIHNVIMEALRPFAETRLANGRDCSTPSSPFAARDCFTKPVAFDVLRGRQKIVGGALCRHKDTLLYQGSIQYPAQEELERQLGQAFRAAFGAPEETAR